MEIQLIVDLAKRSIPVAMLAFLTLTGLTFWYKSFRRARLIEDLSTSRTRSAAQGYVELAGHQYRAPGHATRAPLTGKVCTWWRYRIEQYKLDYFDLGRRNWVTLEQATSDAPILLKDEAGEILVDPRGAEIFPAIKERWHRTHESAQRPVTLRDEPRGRFRYTEERMHEGDSLYVAGQMRTPTGHRVSADFDAAYNRVLDRWKRNQPELARRFDADADGRIDSSEWDMARAAARNEALAAMSARNENRGVDVICKPDDDQPFIIAATPQSELARKYHRYARNNLLLSIICGGGALYLFYLFFLSH